jgi:hypothetical protein
MRLGPIRVLDPSSCLLYGAESTTAIIKTGIHHRRQLSHITGIIFITLLLNSFPFIHCLIIYIYFIYLKYSSNIYTPTARPTARPPNHPPAQPPARPTAHPHPSTRPHVPLLLYTFPSFLLYLPFNNMSSLCTSFIQYNYQHQVAICSDCQTGHTKKNLKRHLSGPPHSLKKHQWKPILNALKDKPLLQSYAHFPRPANGSQSVPYLKIDDGFECNICGFVITSRQVMETGHGKCHKEDLNWDRKTFYHPVKVQVSFPHIILIS